MKSHEPCALILGAESILHHPIPDFPGRPVFRDFLEKIIVRVEKETQSRSKIVHIKPAPLGPFDIFNAVVKRERQLLQSRRTRLANVISADGNSVEAWREFRAKLESVDHQPH